MAERLTAPTLRFGKTPEGGYVCVESGFRFELRRQEWTETRTWRTVTVSAWPLAVRRVSDDAIVFEHTESRKKDVVAVAERWLAGQLGLPAPVRARTRSGWLPDPKMTGRVGAVQRTSDR